MTPSDVQVMRVYLRQWIETPGYGGAWADILRTQVNEITSRADISRWLDRAADLGLDPL